MIEKDLFKAFGVKAVRGKLTKRKRHQYRPNAYVYIEKGSEVLFVDRKNYDLYLSKLPTIFFKAMQQTSSMYFFRGHPVILKGEE